MDLPETTRPRGSVPAARPRSEDPPAVDLTASADAPVPAHLADRPDARELMGDKDLSALLSVPCWVYDEETLRLLVVNDAAVAAYGWTRPEFLTLTLHDILPPGESATVADSLGAVTGTSHEEIRRHMTRQGRVVSVRIRTRPVRWGARPARFSMISDITAEIAAAQERDEVRALSEAVLDAAPEAVIIATPDGTITRVNEVTEQMFGVSADRLLGAPLSWLMPHPVAARHQSFIDEFLRSGRDRVNDSMRRLIARRADGSTFPVDLSLAEVKGPTGRAFAALIRDVSAEVRTSEELARAAVTDTLTRLPRRHIVEERLAQAMTEELPVAVILIDLERFHLVNDGFGSEAGDAVLRETAERLALTAAEVGALVCRSGGDEFLVVAPRTSATAGVHLAERLITAVENPVELGPGRIVPRARAGVTVRSRTGSASHALVAEAYGAARSARGRAGRKVAISARGQAEAARRSLDTEDALRRGLAMHEFDAVFQPVVRLADGAVVAAEALVRWQRPDVTVLPGEFIPLAEETGLIVDLGAQVLDAAVAATARVLDAFGGARRGWRTWVNVSARELGPELVGRLDGTLARHGVDAAHLGVELTETALLSAEEFNAELISDLHELGLLVALDDFGTGYSSLSFLRTLPADVVKIDRSFVSGMDADPGAAAIVRALVALGSALGLDVVAEGVERPEEAQLLRDLGCTYAQGWLFGRPDSLDALLRRLTHRGR